MCFSLHEVARYDLNPFVGSIQPYRRFAGKLMSPGVGVQIVDDADEVVETGRSKTPGVRQRSGFSDAEVGIGLANDTSALFHDRSCLVSKCLAGCEHANMPYSHSWTRGSTIPGLCRSGRTT